MREDDDTALSVIPAPSVIPAQAGIQGAPNRLDPRDKPEDDDTALPVIPAQAGIQGAPNRLDPRDKPEDDAMQDGLTLAYKDFLNNQT